MSNYVKTLSKDILLRYADKITVINNEDPYTLPAKELSTDFSLLLEVTIIDIMVYYCLTHSTYTGDQLKAYKSLEAYKYVQAGFVKNVSYAKRSENFVVLGEVRHSMKSDYVKPWVILKPDGAILSAHCTFMAGLGEAGSHTAALAFFLHVSNVENLSCTDQLAKWPVPKINKQLDFKKIKDIDFGKPTVSYSDVENKTIPPLEGPHMQSFLNKLNDMDPSAAIFRIMQPFASQQVMKVVENLPKPWNQFYKEEFRTWSLEQLQRIKLKLIIDETTQMAVYNATKKQSKCQEWYYLRSGRITASQFKACCSTSIDKPSVTLIKSICYSQKQNLSKIPSIKYECDNELNGIKSYQSKMSKLHQNLELNEAGLAISLKTPIFAASPDALSNCDCCGTGCVEIKCPYSMIKHEYIENHQVESIMSIEEYAKSKNSCLIETNDGLTLNKENSWYYQIQLQMYCTETHHCDFVIWSKRDTFITRINFDEEFLCEKLKIAGRFHEKVIVPELLSKYFTQPIYEPALNIISDKDLTENQEDDAESQSMDTTESTFSILEVKI